ncbi:hypothetical protein [Neobacillus sp. PS3-40]|uniref:hypothetical protein n=1 Tax=Neobacillus sp. PS3-40 TaxID=3070679 RepID=UPI0027E1983F|nr:hypothetical protein [Neobacillus sp. PS3-40]WML43116.1 hypothetical protein RCG20_15075 [Neobacillus sp. PS3-40]
MYFFNNEHEENYKRLLLKFPKAESDREYQVAVYCVAFPNIYGVINGETGRYPFIWMRRGKEVEYTEVDDNGEEYSVWDIKYQDGDCDGKGNPKLSDLYLQLNDIDRLLVQIGEGLYNGNSTPILYDIAVVFSHQNRYWKLFDQMIQIRRGDIEKAIEKEIEFEKQFEIMRKSRKKINGFTQEVQNS